MLKMIGAESNTGNDEGDVYERCVKRLDVDGGFRG